jgi:hypothetical protein
MTADLSVAPSDIDNAGSPGPQRPSSDATRGYRRLANLELAMASLVLILAGCLGYLTVSFLIWAVRQGDVPLFGMFMAASIRAGAALVCGTVGLLLLKAARAARGAAEFDNSTTNKRMRDSHMILLIGSLSLALLAISVFILFFVALAQSNM